MVSKRRIKIGGSKYRHIKHRRTFYKKAARNKASMQTIRSVLGMPDKTRVKLKYQVPLSMASGGGVLAQHVFRGNGPFDPDLTGGGTQPLAYDQWASFYDKQRTRGTKLSVQMSNTNTTTPCIVSLFPSTLATALSTPQEIMSQPYCSTSLMSISAGTSRSHSLSRYMSTKKMFGLKSIDEEDNLASLIGTTPTDQWYWHIYIFSPSGSTSVTAMGIVSMTFFVEFFNRNQLTSS